MAEGEFEDDLDEDGGEGEVPKRPEGALKPIPRSRKPERFTGTSDIYATVDFPLKKHISPHGQVTAVSMMKDEGPFVLEWIAHHLAVGFTDILVYTNDCSDGTDDMLIRLEQLGLAHHRRNVIPEGLRPQPSALNYAQEDPVVQAADWLMVFDADEFLSIRYGDGTLDDLIAAAVAQEANGIVITWRIFGSGGVIDWSRAPVTEQYLMAAPTTWNKGWGVKTLFRFDADYWKLGIHRPKLKNKVIDTAFPDHVKWLNGSGKVMDDYFKFRGWRSITRTVGYDWVQLNHYAVKSVESYAIRRLRGNVNNKADKYNPDYWALQDRNEVRDDTMLRYTDRRNAIMDQLLADPVLNRLHFAALERVETRLQEIRQTEAYANLRAGLELASQIPIGQITAKPPQPRDKEKIAALMSDVEKRRSAKARDERKAEPKEPVEVMPGGLYLPGPLAAAEDLPLDWTANHMVELPADPRIFTPQALALIGTGRFERALARRLPGLLPAQGRLLDIGAGCGFLSAQLARTRGGLQITLIEDDPGLRATLARVIARNGLAGRADFVLADDALPAGDALAALVARHRPDMLLLSDPRLAGDPLPALVAALPNPLPGVILINGRLLEHGFAGMDAAAGALALRGYAPGLGFEPSVARGFTRTVPA
ncbi:glycosyltransferase family 2 protein [Frigidibacter mobilis]|uniref:Glycosyl transferase family 2 n=1 Tax=Frigidibacter mobilis TaxID=1335048 RepID=A0A161GJH9_9RHOB|nr:glycosyltransferase family 2 protein [Frigidibacter mobilis]AMY68553.1 hypothetical protein AKL17_1297 [Frigidibacter mobilis]